jgi:hypothetical protein
MLRFILPLFLLAALVAAGCEKRAEQQLTDSEIQKAQQRVKEEGGKPPGK